MTTEHTKTPVPKTDSETQFMMEQKQIERNYLKMFKKAEQVIKQNKEIAKKIKETAKKIEETNNQNEELIKQSKQMDNNIIISSLIGDHTKTPIPKIGPELQSMIDQAVEIKKTIATMVKQKEESKKEYENIVSSSLEFMQERRERANESIPKINPETDPETLFIMKQNIKRNEMITNMFKQTEQIKNMVSSVKETIQQTNKNKRKKSDESIKIKKENKKRKITNIPHIQRTPCPSCMSWKTTGFLYNEEKGEWIYACRETYIINSSNGCCGNMWIESDRTPTHKCACGGYRAHIGIRKQKPGYCCSECDIFKPF